MSPSLEDRLERAVETLPVSGAASRDRARRAALAALGSPPKRRRWRLGVLVPAIVAALAVVAIVAAPWRESPLAAERALAALGHRPVVHAVVEQSSPRQTVIDLASGEERVETSRAEYWYDDERDRLRVRLTLAGMAVPGGEYVESRDGFFTDRGVTARKANSPRIDPALAGFATGYREALDSGEATVVGEEVVDGQEAVILRVAVPSGRGSDLSEEVAVTADDYRPLRFRLSSGSSDTGPTPWVRAPRVAEIETIARSEGDFAPPQAGEPRPARQTGDDERTLTPAEAATALGRPVPWPGTAIAGLDLAQIKLVRVTTQWTDGRVTEGRALTYQYGADRRTGRVQGTRPLIVTAGTSSEVLRFDLGGPPLRPIELRLLQAGNPADEMWFGALERDGVYISLESPQRELIVAAAKAMAVRG